MYLVVNPDTQVGAIYLVLDGLLRRIPNPATLATMHGSRPAIQVEVSVPGLELEGLPVGRDIPDGAAMVHSAGTVYFMDVDPATGELYVRGICSPTAMAKYDFPWTLVELSPFLMQLVRRGPSIC